MFLPWRALQCLHFPIAKIIENIMLYSNRSYNIDTTMTKIPCVHSNITGRFRGQGIVIIIIIIMIIINNKKNNVAVIIMIIMHCCHLRPLDFDLPPTSVICALRFASATNDTVNNNTGGNDVLKMNIIVILELRILTGKNTLK